MTTAVIITAAFALAFQAHGTPIARGATLCVDPHGSHGCSTTIQAAVNAAAAGDTISVNPGTYPEVVTISKSVTLQGTNAAATRVDASGQPDAFDIKSGQVTVTGFTAENAQLAGTLVNASSLVAPVRSG